MSNTASEPLLLNSKQLAAKLNISTRTVANLVKRDIIKPTRIGDRLLFSQDELVRVAREGTKAVPVVDRYEFDAFLTTIENAPSETLEGQLYRVLHAFHNHLCGIPATEGVRSLALHLAGELLDTVTALGHSRTAHQRQAVKFLTAALAAFKR